ncbi:myb domain-containing protein [Cryptosporidium ryanae]|uniref:myb domain-containing protein n=1 Tax=Cryptosporidium ryanae TaxID=515981 RepID=UPI00351A08DF|nr:myb domain-containing protein [Cryptosporidium ryanae]
MIANNHGFTYVRSWNDHINNPNILKGKFSSKEREIINLKIKEYFNSQNWEWDEGLEHIFSNNKGKKENHWSIIGEALPNRSLQSIYYFSKRMIGSGKKGKWSPEEENELIKLVGEYGQKWSMFTEFIGRSAASIRDKWRDLSPRIEKCKQDITLGGKLSSNSEKFLNSKMPFVIDLFVLYCIEYYTGEFLPFKGISWKTIIDSLSLPLFPTEFLRFWRKCSKYLIKKEGIELQPIVGDDLSDYSGRISQSQIRLRYISSLYPKIKSIQVKQANSQTSNIFFIALKYLYDTRYEYSTIDEIKYNDWPKILSVDFPLTTLWSRIRLSISRLTDKTLHISDRIAILFEKFKNKQTLASITQSEFIEIFYSTENIAGKEGSEKRQKFCVNSKRLRKIVLKLIKQVRGEKIKSKNTNKSHCEYSSLQQVIFQAGMYQHNKNLKATSMGLEPTTFGSEDQRHIH